MLEDIIEWLTSAGGRVNFFVFPVVENGETFSWTDPGLVGAFIGAAASTLIALFVLIVSTKIEQQRRAKDKVEFDSIRAEDQALIASQRTEDRLRREAADALSTFSKISRYANAILAVKNAIDVRFSEVTADAPWSAPTAWSSLNVSAWSTSGLSGRCFLALVDGTPERCAV